MWSAMLVLIRTIIDKIHSTVVRINISMLGLLRAGSLSTLFWTLVLTGSFGAAVPVLVIGCVLSPVKSRFS